jgi:predicted NAD-dependent protein-ADP-ribosyltransferase YbiA (DUF1768 family)/O-acetyl-ADP-ribose deacetylase (regulator of RNase III)
MARNAARDRQTAQPQQGQRAAGYGSGYQGGAAKPAVKPLGRIGGRWTVEELVAMVPTILAPRDGDAFGRDAYAGIGSRETPDDVMADMTSMARVLEKRGVVMRSGGAPGADTAFQKGTSDRDMRQVFIPKIGFNGNREGVLMDPRHEQTALELVQRYHPAPERLSGFALQLMMRNGCQMFGEHFDDPSKVVVCYTPDGAASGGTGQAIRMAEDAGIPVLNLRIPEIREAVLAELGIERAREREVVAFDFSADRAEQSWDRSKSAVFFRGADEYGPLMNMTPRFPYEDGGVRYGSGEHQYQAMRYPHRPDIQERIIGAKDAFEAKKIAYEHIDETRPDWKEINLEAMAYVVSRRRDQIPDVRRLQDQAHERGVTIVEQSSKDRFWGAVEQGGKLSGRNMLGWVHDQAAAGARMDQLPRGTTLPTMADLMQLKEARLEAEARGEPAPVVHRQAQERQAEAPRQQSSGAAPSEGPGAVRHRPGSDVSRLRADVIVNTVNANLSKASKDGSRQEGNPVMGAGVAKAFKERYGEAILRPYAAAIRDGSLRAGGVQMLRMPDGQVVANLATKQDWRDPSKMEWIESGLKALADEMRRGGHESIALPPPGCGHGGLDWKDVEPLVLKHLKDFDVTITAAPSGVLTGRDGQQSRGVEGRASVLEQARDVARGRVAEKPAMEATMYFSYGRGRRPGVQSASTFEAVLSGERTSTTRFDNWKGSDRWGRMKPGTVVRMFEDQDKSGRFVDVRVTGVERIDLAGASPERLEDWSKAEGWSVEAGREYGRKNQPGWQVRYEPIPGQEILRQRERDDDLPLLAAAQARMGNGR